MSRKTISVPMQVLALRLTAEEKARLQEIADKRRVTLSWVLREAARLAGVEPRPGAACALPSAAEIRIFDVVERPHHPGRGKQRRGEHDRAGKISEPSDLHDRLPL